MTRAVAPGAELIDGDAPGTSATATLARLREARFGFATSLSQLGSFPFAELRIDRGLVRECDHSRHRQSLVHSAVDLARQLRARTVAEGIETIGEWNVLVQAGCAEGQGYYVAPPMAAAALPKWLQTWRAAFAARPAAGSSLAAPGGQQTAPQQGK
jgi:EAL domain-containing protein (putative c-di-GMP-specific phosphodiesterase class I)